MDALSKNELRYEVERGSQSRFGAAYSAYLKQRLAQIEDSERSEERSEDVGIARQAIRLSKIAIGLSIVALIASAIGALVAGD